MLAAAVLALVRLWVAGRLNLAEDEAYYWEWSRSLDWSYYDQGPGLALAIRLGTWLLGPTELGVRLLGVVGGFGVSAAAAWITADALDLPGMALWVVLAFNGCLIFAVGGVLMMHDSLMAVGWIGALACGLKALRGSPRWWIGVGLAAGWALLSKYTAVLLDGCLVLGLVAVPELRRQCRTPWPWIGLLIAALAGVPLLGWNAAHGWPSLRHIGSLAGGDAHRRRGVPWLELLGSQAALVTPVLWFACLAGWARAALRWRAGRDTPAERWLLVTSLPVALFFQALSFHSRVEGNWPAVAYLGALPLAAGWLNERSPRGGWGGRLGVWSLGVAWAMTILVFTQALVPFLPFPQRFAKADVPARLAGWADLGRRVAQERAALGGAGVFTAATTYQNAAELAFYQPGQPRSLLLSAGLPGNEYRFWNDAPLHVGQDAVLVVGQDWEEQGVSARFRALEPLPDWVFRRNGIEVRRMHLWRAYGFKG